MKTYAALFALFCVLVILLPAQAQDNDQRITPDNAKPVASEISDDDLWYITALENQTYKVYNSRWFL